MNSSVLSVQSVMAPPAGSAAVSELTAREQPAITSAVTNHEA